MAIYTGKDSVAKWARRIAIGALIAFMTVILVGPWLLYEIALSNVIDRPLPPGQTIVSAADADDLWRRLREPQPVNVERQSPYDFLLRIVWCSIAQCPGSPVPPRGTKVAWCVARWHNATHLKERRGLWWHASGAALTIWLTRNWTTDQLVSKVIEMKRVTEAGPPQRVNQPKRVIDGCPAV
jgi:hypothetical protein